MSRTTLARTAGILCGREDFWRFLADSFPQAWAQFGGLRDAERAATVIRAICCIESRRELDTNSTAARSFHTKLGLPFNAWRRARSLAR